jgi:hypothetical protein
MTDLPNLPDPNLVPRPPSGRHAYPLPTEKIQAVISMPTSSSIAFIDDDDGLHSMRIDEEKLTMSLLAKGYFPSVSGGDLSSLAPPHPEACAYLQTRRLVFFDLMDRSAASYEMTRNREEIVLKGRWLSPTQRCLALQIRDTTPYLEDGSVLYRLVIVDVQTGKPRFNGTIELGTERRHWSAGGGLLALVRDGFLEVLGPDAIAKMGHPLTVAMQSHRVYSVLLHPTKEMALVATMERDRASGADFTLWFVRWNDPKNPTKSALLTIESAEDVGRGGFSPDDHWCSFDTAFDGRYEFYLLNLDNIPRAPELLLSSDEPKAALFVHDPVSFVIFDDDLHQVTLFRLEQQEGR